jgi:pyruvate formate lyase activating enzyme
MGGAVSSAVSPGRRLDENGMKGIVTDIQRFSVHDGPGIRTTVFLKGCNLRCRWCHNPETIHPHAELQVLPDRCIACGACLTACPRGAHVLAATGEAPSPEMGTGTRRGGSQSPRREFRRQFCQACGACAAGCYAGALTLVGRELTAEEVLAEVLQDRRFYENSGGGMTLSGGEPLFQHAFTMELLRQAKAAGLHSAVETNLAWPWEHVAAVAELADLMIVDVKLADSAAHRQWTGQDNEQVLANLARLGVLPSPAPPSVPGEITRLIVRTPVVPGVNDTPRQIGQIADLLAGLGSLAYYELLPYHPLGSGKYESLGMAYELAEAKRPPPETMRALAAEARNRGIPVRTPDDPR